VQLSRAATASSLNWHTGRRRVLDASRSRPRSAYGSKTCRPVRPLRFEKGRRGFAGWWWLATTGQHVAFQSWLQRDHVMLLDRDPDVVAVSSQPFWLLWRGVDGVRRCAPPFFVRHANGSGSVLDVRMHDRVGERDLDAVDATARACALAGWDYRRVGPVDRSLAANVRWLSRYRHPRCRLRGDVATALTAAFAEPIGLFAGADRVGERLSVLPVLFHLMWRGVLSADLSAGPLRPTTSVHATGGA
jgi:hypothetical protein